MNDEEQFEETYKDSSYSLLVFEYKNGTAKLTLKGGQLPGVKESGIFGIKKVNGKYVFNFGLGKEEYDDDDVPNPIKKLVGGTSGAYIRGVDVPSSARIIRRDFTFRPYADYRRDFFLTKVPYRDDGRALDKPLPRGVYMHLVKFYLAIKGVPLYL